MNYISCSQAWIYSYGIEDVAQIAALNITGQYQVVGSSCPPPSGSIFPRSGIISAMYAAMRGELNLLLVEANDLLGKNQAQVEDMISTFHGYGVSVRSCSNNGRISS